MSRASEPVPNLSETCAEPVSALVADAVHAGLTLRVEAGELVVRGPRSRIELGRAVIARKAEVLAHLSALDGRWDATAAVRRMEAADAAVAASGGRGSAPAVRAAVARACEAYRLQDMAGLIHACEGVATLAGGAPVVSQDGRPAPKVTCPAAGEPTLVVTGAGLAAVASAVAASDGPIGLDTETTGLDHARHRVRLLQLATPRGAFLIDVFAVGPAALAPVFEALAGVDVVGHNLGFDLPFLMRIGFAPGRVIDTMLASQVLHAGDIAVKHGLRDVAVRHLGLTLDKELQQADWAGTLTPDMLRYAALDAEVPLRAWPELAAELAAAKLTAVAETEFAALPCVAWAACRGVGLDRPGWKALAADADAERARLREALDAAAPDGASLFGARNWDSPDDVKVALTAVGVALEATDDDALAAVAHPLAGLVRDYRSAARLATTYGRDWLRHVAADGRVYATWKQIGA
ncbi:MAG TPA: hypothetical protein VD866_24130, partial [Urbifossiella sp.]|nr:hypothetical protein [Urbifossiella sp.]